MDKFKNRFVPQKFIIPLEICGLDTEGFYIKIYGKVMFIMFKCVKVNHKAVRSTPTRTVNRILKPV